MIEFKEKVVVITGGAKGIGKCIAEEFRKEGALVEVIDKAEGEHYVGDISDKTTLEALFCARGFRYKYLFFQRPDEPAADGKLYCRKRRDIGAYSRHGH